MRTRVGPPCYLDNQLGWLLPSICEENRGGIAQ